MNETRTILVADDDQDLVESLQRRLTDLNFNVVTAACASQAVSLLEQHHADLVILDVELPDGDGLDIRETMLADERYQNTPAIIITGNKDFKTIRRCHNAISYYVPKCPSIWSRIKPLLSELLVEETRDPTSTAIGTQVTQYQESDQSAFFDWVVDMVSDEPTESQTNQPIEDESPWVLCIDDDADLSYGWKLRLQKHGVEMERAFSGMSGYGRAFTGAPAAIILDFEMPDGQGDYVLRRLKESSATRDIPVIVVTGFAGHALERKMYNLGAAAFLRKPCPWDELWTVLQRYLGVSIS